MKSNDRPLTEKQELFAQHLARTHDIREAGRQAGYTPGHARNLSADDRVKRRVRELNAEQVERLGVDGDQLIQEIAALAFSDITQAIRVGYEELETLPAPVRKAISNVKVRHYYDAEGRISHSDCEIRMHNKVEAQRLLANILQPQPETEDDQQQGWTGLTVITGESSDGQQQRTG